jgi:hypothetical protein
MARSTNLKFFAARPEVQLKIFCRMAKGTNPKYFAARPKVQT